MMPPEAFEQLCLTEIRTQFDARSNRIAHFGRRIAAVRLEGRCPDTKVVVEFFEDGSQRKMEYSLWEDFRAPEGTKPRYMEYPCMLGSLLVDEYAEPGQVMP